MQTLLHIGTLKYRLWATRDCLHPENYTIIITPSLSYTFSFDYLGFKTPVNKRYELTLHWGIWRIGVIIYKPVPPVLPPYKYDKIKINYFK